MAKAILIKTQGSEMELVDIKGWSEIAPLLNADCFDVTQRKIDNHIFTIYVDDSGFLRDTVIPTALDSGDLAPMLVGNLLILQTDPEGNDRDLTDEEVEIIDSNTLHLVEWNGSEYVERVILMLDERPRVRLCDNCELCCYDINGEPFCSAISNYPTIAHDMECLLGIPE